MYYFLVKYNHSTHLLFIFLTVCIISCTTQSSSTSVIPQPQPDLPESLLTHEEQRENLLLTFAGDIMAHTVNFNMKNYDDIYDDVRPFLTNDDLSFANFETPVAESLPMATYPRFNVHSSYLDAAIKGGFDVFSLANNHSNDQGETGITETLAVCKDRSSKIYFSGMRETANNLIEPIVIEKKGWKILFLAITEITNSYDLSMSRVYYISTTSKARNDFLQQIRQMREIYECDVFILSIHLLEEEYGLQVTEKKKEWFKSLCDAGVDILWAHHPHVMQHWELLPSAENSRSSLAMYSMGNFISGQRYTPVLTNPSGYREYTGDAVLLRVVLSDFADITVEPLLITNYTDPYKGPVVRRFTTHFIEGLSKNLQEYYIQRKRLMHEYLPLLPEVKPQGILNK